MFSWWVLAFCLPSSTLPSNVLRLLSHWWLRLPNLLFISSLQQFSIDKVDITLIIERSRGGWGGWVAEGVESPPGGCNWSSKLSCGVEELKSSVDTVAKTREASMEEGRACPSWLTSTSTTSSRWLPAWGLRAFPNSIWMNEPPTWGEADPAFSTGVDSEWAAGYGDLSVAEAEEARGLRSYLLVNITTSGQQSVVLFSISNHKNNSKSLNSIVLITELFYVQNKRNR